MAGGTADENGFATAGVTQQAQQPVMGRATAAGRADASSTANGMGSWLEVQPVSPRATGIARAGLHMIVMAEETRLKLQQVVRVAPARLASRATARRTVSIQAEDRARGTGVSKAQRRAKPLFERSHKSDGMFSSIQVIQLSGTGNLQ